MTQSVQLQRKRFSVATLGCKVNQFESADMIEQLQREGWQQVEFGEEVELCLINTCTVTARSDAESRRLIRRARRATPQARIVATGCYAQVAPELLKELPEVDQVLGNEEKHALTQHLCHGGHRITNLQGLQQSGPLQLTSFAEHTRAFLQVQNGCETGCSYCIVPLARGSSRSVPQQEVLEAVQRLAVNGFQEVVLTGIHLGAYGLDLSPASSLRDLVRALNHQGLMARLRLGSIEPNELTDALLELFSSSKRLCHHLHIPLQSGSDTVLQRMARRYVTSLYRNRVNAAARLLPDAFIAADVIAGFPGETEQEFQDTCDLITELPLADLHVFPYSRRPGTAAADMSGQLQPTLIKERAEQLRGLAAQKRSAFQQRFLGSTLQVLGLRFDPTSGLMSGLSRNYLEVSYPAEAQQLNHEVEVRIQRFSNGLLHGNCC